MTTQRSRRRPPARKRQTLHKPKGYFHDRVEHAEPAHFGIACFDCHKDYSQWMLADCFGNFLLPPRRAEHTRTGLAQAIDQLRQAVTAHGLRDLVAAVERTGRYHRPAQNALRAAGFDVRMVHPFATKQFRQVANPGENTDDHDLHALHRAAVNGFALAEPERDDFWTSFLRIVRFRRRLTHAAARLRCQIRNDLDAYLPGFADAAFADFGKNHGGWPIAAGVLGPQDILDRGADGLAGLLRDQGVRFHRRSLPPIVAWAATALPADVAAANARRLALLAEEERRHKGREIQALEVELAEFVCRTPYVLLLSCAGLNSASIADSAAELGPIEHYASAKGITGRAGLYPSRYQSGQVDRRGGPLVGCANRKLRAALLRGADCVLSCHPYFHDLGARGRAGGAEPHRVCVKVANRLCRVLYQVVAGRQVFNHPQGPGRHYILDKGVAFHAEHSSAAAATRRDLEAALAQVPATAYAAEARPLCERLQARRRGRAADAQGLAELLPEVLARLGVKAVASTESGVLSPR
jgi:transposase